MTQVQTKQIATILSRITPDMMKHDDRSALVRDFADMLAAEDETFGRAAFEIVAGIRN